MAFIVAGEVLRCVRPLYVALCVAQNSPIHSNSVITNNNKLRDQSAIISNSTFSEPVQSNT